MKSKRRKILVTGGAGFIASEFVRLAVKKNDKIIVVDKLTYAGDLERLKNVKGRFTFYKTDICNGKKMDSIMKKERPDIIVHYAAETHVDRSILDASDFIKTNVIGTQILIDLAHRYKTKKFIHMSTDEVYGESRRGFFKESDPIRPNNPYSASKAAAEHLISAAIRTFQLPAIIVRAANNYGPWQYPEKFVPVILLKAMNNQRVPVYGKGLQMREWLHISDSATAMYIIMKKGKIGEIYNIGSNFEQNNLKTAKAVLKFLGKPEKLIQFVKDRPGHDFRYRVDTKKLRRLGWKPKITFKMGMNDYIQWSKNHKKWFKDKQKEVQSYWRRIYKLK